MLVAFRSLVWAAVLWLLAAGGAAAETIRVGITSDYPPFNFLDADQVLAGFDVDITNALCARMAAECSFVVMDWNELIPALLDRRCDAIVASMSVTEERLQRVAFTNRYYRTAMQFVARRGFDAPITPEGLRGRRVSYSQGTRADTYVNAHFGTSVTAVPFVTEDEVNGALIRGDADLILADSLVMWPFLRSPAGQPFQFVGTPIYGDEEVAIALRKEDTDLLRRFNRALTIIRTDGTHQAINAKYFPFDIY